MASSTSVAKYLLSFSLFITVSFLSGCSHFSSHSAAANSHKQSRFLGEFSENLPASFPSTRVATGNKTFIYDPKKLMWAAYNEEGHLIKQGRGSGGRTYCPDLKRACKTPAGQFRITRTKGVDCKSSKYPLGKGGAPMPYCSYFHGGYAIHGSNHLPNYNASHGCIRVHPRNAQWLQSNFLKIGTDVIVKPYSS